MRGCALRRVVRNLAHKNVEVNIKSSDSTVYSDEEINKIRIEK